MLKQLVFYEQVNKFLIVAIKGGHEMSEDIRGALVVINEKMKEIAEVTRTHDKYILELFENTNELQREMIKLKKH